MLFAAFVLEKEPMRWSDVPVGLLLWLQNAGFLAALTVVLVYLVHKSRPKAQTGLSTIGPIRAFLASPMSAMVVLGIVGMYVAAGAAFVLLNRSNLGNWLLVAAGGLSLLLVLIPPMHAVLFKIRWGRVWAMARLSQKEAIRNRVFLVFMAFALIFLFADWFVGGKPADQVRNYVRVLYWSISPIFLLTAALLGAFSIPNDIKNLSIHTIVTKPIEKFEVVLGRFLGYAVVLTVSLVVVSGLSLIYVARGVTEEARRESLKARVPVYGASTFFRTKGESVGREWEYRKYIGGAGAEGGSGAVQYAAWRFDELADLSQGEGNALLEYSFDIFRLTKGDQDRGVYCVFTLFAGYEDEIEPMERKMDAYVAERNKMRAAGKIDEAALIAKHGLYQKSDEEVSDYVIQRLEVPRALFAEVAKKEGKLQVMVNIDRFNVGSRQQMLGVANRDLYVLENERSFYANFIKGIIGLWMSFMLTLAVAVACSTRLSGVISFLCAIFYYFAGMVSDYILRLAEQREAGGGPAEAAFRLFTRSSVGAPLQETPGASLLQGFDAAYLWVLRRLVNLVPDVNRFDLHSYVANGFDIGWSRILLVDNFLPLVGYLIPWAVLAYYLMNSREIANPT
jgi:hypothetical protein